MDPATWSWLTCTWLIQTSIGGIVGNRVDAQATEVWTQGWQAFSERMRGDHRAPINQDLAVAVHRSFLLAQLSLIHDCLSELTGGTWTEHLPNAPAVMHDYSKADVDQLEQKLKQVKAAIRALDKGNCPPIPAQALEMSEALIQADHAASEESQQRLRAELPALFEPSDPEAYRLRAVASDTGLLERVSAYFAFQLKTNPALRGLFQNQLLVQINERLQGLSVQPIKLDEIEESLRQLTAQLPDVVAGLNNLEIAVDDVGESVDEVRWLVDDRTGDLIALAISHSDNLAELKSLVLDVLRQLQQQSAPAVMVDSGKSAPPRTREGVNPFIYGPAVPPECFYGRKEQLAHIRQRIGGRAPQCVNVVGLRRNGKSSVLRYVKERTDEFFAPEQRPIVILLDLQDRRFHQPTGIIEGLRRNIERQTEKSPWAKADNDDLFEVEDGLEALREQGYRLIVMFDEFEAIGERLEVFHDWGDHWRSQASAGRLSLVIASRRPVSDIYQRLELTSPFGNIFSTIVLGALDTDSWKKLLTDGDLSTEEIGWVNELGGQLPYYAQLAAAMVWQYGCLDLARRGFWEQANSLFVALWRGLSKPERLALQYYSSHTASSAIPQPQTAMVETLKLHGLLRADEQVFSSFFSDFVQRQMRQSL